jgi:SAM-dependent methyltransferase
MTSSVPAPERAGAAVLAAREEIEAAARGLDEHGWSWPRRTRVLTRAWRAAADLRLATYPLTRDRTKSWDVWRAVHHCLATVPRDGLVFDVGAWQSEILWALGRNGYTRLAGCDTDPRVTRMPGARRIDYRVADFFDAALPAGSAAAITCLSVIEHGMDVEAFLLRSAEALGPGGRLLVTTDYWPDGLETAGLSAFGRPWTVASRATVRTWLERAAALGLEPDGPVGLDAATAPITWNSRSYTFLWMALSKRG